MNPPPIVLLTDFGDRDWYAGTLKGVIAGIAPGHPVLDLTHQIEPGDIHAAAFALLAAYSYYPAGTVFCCVVDPGVGTERAGICASDGRYFYVAPDNGLVGHVAREAGTNFRAHRLDNPELRLPRVSSTYHGRDVFAPAAAHLARGVGLEAFGPRHEPLLPEEEPLRMLPGEIQGRIIYADIYGNLFTNIRSDSLQEYPEGGFPDQLKLILHGKRDPAEIQGLLNTFGEVAPGEPLFYPGSSGYIEIAVNQGNARSYFDTGVGQPVRLLIGKEQA